MMRSLVLISLMCCFSIPVCFPQEYSENLVNHALEQLDIPPEQCDFNLVTEQYMSDLSDHTVLVIPKIESEDEESVTYTAYILIVDSNTGDILSRYCGENSWVSDYFRLISVRIEGPYLINRDHRAFGIITSFRGSSRANPYDEEYYSLYMPEGDTLTKLLDNYLIYSYYGEYDNFCEGHFQETVKEIVFPEEKTKRFNQLILKSNIREITQFKNENDECDEQSENETLTSTLRFKDGQYR